VGIKDLEDLKKLSMLKSQIDAVPVSDIAEKDFPTLSPDNTVSDALTLMRKTGYQEIPIIDGGIYGGMIRYSVILRKKSASPDTKLKSLISSLPAVEEGTEITKIAEIMVTNNCRQLAVVTGKKVTGVVSRTALIGIAAQSKSLRDVKVWEIMTTPVEYVRDTAMLSEAIDTMRRLDIRTMPVVNSAGKLVGVVGMNEVIENGWKPGERNKGVNEAKTQTPVQSVAVTAVVTVDWEDDMSAAADIMAEKHISTLPVTDRDEMVGILTEYDIIELISACREREQLYVQISGLDDEDKIYAEAMYDDIGKEMAKVSKIYKPESLTIHVTRYNESGDRKKYSLIGKLFVSGRTYNSKAVGWDLVQTNKELVQALGGQVKSEKDSHVSRRKKTKS
jgi:CBS domain-containing protein